MGSLGATLWQSVLFIRDQLLNFRFIDFVDIAIVAILLYYVYKFIHDRRAGKLAAGVAILLLLQVISELLNMNALRFIMANIFQVGLVAVMVVFQPELRSALEKMADGSWKRIRDLNPVHDPVQVSGPFIREVCNAVMDMANSKTGALIVLERSTPLGDILKTGTTVNADVSAALLKNIFFKNSPLHDGAVVIRNSRILAAGCFLPSSQREEISKDLGTRHRAGIGMSENSDAAVIIVSEETGTVSVAEAGNLDRHFGYDQLRSRLEAFYQPPKKPSAKTSRPHVIKTFTERKK